MNGIVRLVFMVLALGLLAFSCAESAKVEAMESTDATKVAVVKDDVAVAKATEDFKVFFDRFSKDSVFQKDRIEFPLMTRFYEDVTEPLVLNYFQESDFPYIDFREDAFAMQNETDKFTVEIVKEGDLMVYRRKGYDNGILVSYKFKLVNDAWFLIEVLDESS